MNTRQMRSMKKYAHANGLGIEEAALQWCLNGCAKRWRDYHDQL